MRPSPVEPWVPNSVFDIHSDFTLTRRSLRPITPREVKPKVVKPEKGPTLRTRVLDVVKEKGAVEVPDLSKIFDLPAKQLKKALEGLVQAGSLVRKRRSPGPGRHQQYDLPSE